MLPSRDDDVAAWLKRERDRARELSYDNTAAAIDNLLDDYRLHADTGTPLLKHACDGPNCCDNQVPTEHCHRCGIPIADPKTHWGVCEPCFRAVVAEVAEAGEDRAPRESEEPTDAS